MTKVGENHLLHFVIDDSHFGQVLDVPEFPELHFRYVSSAERLCDNSKLPRVSCFWEGDLSLTLDVNGHEIVINDHDKKRNESQTITVGNYSYKFQGNILYPNPQPHRLEVLITKTANASPSASIVTLAVDEPYTVVLNENVTTGYAWYLYHQDNLKIIDDGRFNNCKPGLSGCGGKRYFIVSGLAAGPATLAVVKRGPDGKNDNVQTYNFSIGQ